MMDDGVYFYSDIKINDSFINKVKRVFTSALMFVVAFIISDSILQFTLGILAKSLGYGVDISFNILKVFPRDYRHWSRPRVAAVFLGGPLFCLLLGVIV